MASNHLGIRRAGGPDDSPDVFGQLITRRTSFDAQLRHTSSNELMHFLDAERRHAHRDLPEAHIGSAGPAGPSDPCSVSDRSRHRRPAIADFGGPLGARSRHREQPQPGDVGRCAAARAGVVIGYPRSVRHCVCRVAIRGFDDGREV
jgi:hypothetical protein